MFNAFLRLKALGYAPGTNMTVTDKYPYQGQPPFGWANLTDRDISIHLPTLQRLYYDYAPEFQRDAGLDAVVHETAHQETKRGRIITDPQFLELGAQQDPSHAAHFLTVQEALRAAIGMKPTFLPPTQAKRTRNKREIPD